MPAGRLTKARRSLLRPVLAGYLAGAALIMIAWQPGAATGPACRRQPAATLEPLSRGILLKRRL